MAGRGLTIVASPDGKRVYAGNNSGVWRSNDGGANFIHMTRPQPPQGTTSVPGALLSLDVYDLAVCITDPNIVLAATNFDIRRPGNNGIYRSTDGGVNWTLVQALGANGQIAATDEPSLFFSGGGQAGLLKSTDFGATWNFLPLSPFNLGPDSVFHVAFGPKPEATRRIYALGTRLWFSTDGGANWQEDTNVPMLGGPPNDAVGLSTRVMAIHPSDPQVVFLIDLVNDKGTVWRGTPGTPGVWTSLPNLPSNVPDTTPSGTRYIHVHQSPTHIYLFASDQSSTQMSIGDSPVVWRQFDDPRFMHLDPHAIWMTPDFRHHSEGGRGRIWQINDGGVYFSTDGAKTWQRARGFNTLGCVNVAVSPVNAKPAAICLQTGDNGAFFSSDGGRNWTSADYQQGDNDTAFVDPKQPRLMYVFAPRGSGVSAGVRLVVYKAPPGKAVDAGSGTGQRRQIFSPSIPNPSLPEPRQFSWNCVSFFTTKGYRPLILTLPTESPRPGGDFITIVYRATGSFLMRTTKLGTTAISQSDWNSTATTEASGAKVFQQGPQLPELEMSIVQASGGHATPVFYVGDTIGLWKWTDGMADWQALIPLGGNAPLQAVRFYVDPFRPDRIFLIDAAHVWRSPDGGTNWAINQPLEAALTENGAFPVALHFGSTPNEAILQDMVFDPSDPALIIAVGPAGVFSTIDDGAHWDTVVRFSALQTRVMTTYLDAVSDPTLPALYVSTPSRGLLKVTFPAKNPVANLLTKTGLGTIEDQAKRFSVFRATPFPDPFITSPDPANPNTARPEGKMQKALTDAITAMAGAHGHTLKTRDPNAADFLDIFPIPFTIADATGAKPYPAAHYNGDEVDSVGSQANLAVLFAAMELRMMVRRFANDIGIVSAQDLTDALKLLEPQILNKVPLFKNAKDVFGRRLPIKDFQRLPDYARILELNDSGPELKIDFKGAVAAEVDPNKKKKDYDFGRSLFDMIVNNDPQTAQNCFDALGYAYINGALEAGGFFERPNPNDPTTFRGIWVGGNNAVERIRGVISINDGPATFTGTTNRFAKLLALIRAGTFADPDDPGGDLMKTLLNQAQTGASGTALSFGSVFTYQMNSLGFAQLRARDPLTNRVGSEVAMIKRENAKKKNYVVAWQNREFAQKGNNPQTVPTLGGHPLYSQADVIDIISKTVAAYE